jgi:cellulose synthase/poly-beta-1,6-N-acetylglucosamine synthase-like glycosyltransferase
LEYPWHRSIDRLLKSSPYQSYRGGNPTTFFVHVPNERKKDINAWYNILKSVEKGNVYLGQRGHVDLLGTAAEWVGQRSEDLIFLVRGRNVPSSVSRRCLKSLLSQRCQRFGVILIDAASTNGAEEFSDEVWRRMLGSRLTVYRNYIPVSPIENIDYAIRNICTNSQSIIAMLDMDDALIGSDVVDIILDLYAHGADVTVGSMLRTDKHKTYTVQFKEPRKNRGGNVWQHLRTFRKYLYDRIPQEDLKLDGEWIPHAEDWAYMVPIVEMAKNPINIQSTIYFYEPSVDKSIRSICVREEIIGRILAKAPRKVEQCQ